MTEAPFVDTLMKKGMGPGPALALLLTGPGLSLPNWLAIARVFGTRKAVVYVLTIIVLGTLVGWAAGQLYFSRRNNREDRNLGPAAPAAAPPKKLSAGP
jgi:uncharacterized membrane protein YraQ (UPF0718 family)